MILIEKALNNFIATLTGAVLGDKKSLSYQDLKNILPITRTVC
jgi:hypothetical protein